MLFAAFRGDVRLLTVVDYCVFGMECVLRASLCFRKEDSNVRRLLRLFTLVRVFRERWVLVPCCEFAIHVCRVGDGTARLNAFSPVNAASRADLAGVALSAVTCARDAVCGCLRERVEADVVSVSCFGGEGFADRCRLARAYLDRRSCFLEDAVVRLYTNVWQCE